MSVQTSSLVKNNTLPALHIPAKCIPSLRHDKTVEQVQEVFQPDLNYSGISFLRHLLVDDLFGRINKPTIHKHETAYGDLSVSANIGA